ncbi:MAG: anti-sigma factor [Pyrinomonadaceae bacterium]
MAVHEDYKEMLAAHGLGALDVEEARTLELHLRDCAECSQELDEWKATAAMLALEPAPVAPSEQLRNRIIDAVRTDVAKSKALGRTVADAAASQREGANVVSLPTYRRSSSGIPSWFAIAAGLVFVVLLGSLFVLWQQNKAARQELARLAAKVEETQQQVARQREVIELVNAPGARVSELAGTKEMPGAHGMVAYDKNGRAILMAKGLPTPPVGKAYQLWFIAGGKPMPGKVFTTDASGTGTLTDNMPSAAMNSPIFAITLEPAGGVQAPTGAIYLSSGA